MFTGTLRHESVRNSRERAAPAERVRHRMLGLRARDALPPSGNFLGSVHDVIEPAAGTSQFGCDTDLQVLGCGKPEESEVLDGLDGLRALGSDTLARAGGTAGAM